MIWVLFAYFAQWAALSLSTTGTDTIADSLDPDSDFKTLRTSMFTIVFTLARTRLVDMRWWTRRF